MTTISIPAEVVALSNDAENQIQIAKGFVIRWQDDYQLAADQLKQIKSKGKALEEQRKTMTQPLDAAKKSIMDFFNSIKKPYVNSGWVKLKKTTPYKCSMNKWFVVL